MNKKKSFILLARGFEEVEALTVVDLMRRAGMDIASVSLTEDYVVPGAHGIEVGADLVFGDEDMRDAEWLVLPGGMPGSTNAANFAPLGSLLKQRAAEGGKIAAICAAPAVVLAPLGLLQGKKATCYPGFEDELAKGGATAVDAPVVADGKVVTAQGPALAMPFALKLIEISCGAGFAAKVAEGLLYK